MATEDDKPMKDLSIPKPSPISQGTFNTPADIAKGGGSRIDTPDFGSLYGNRRRDQERRDVNSIMTFNQEVRRASRVGYRRAIQRGDTAAAIRSLELGTSRGAPGAGGGLTTFEQRAEAAKGQLDSYRAMAEQTPGVTTSDEQQLGNFLNKVQYEQIRGINEVNDKRESLEKDRDREIDNSRESVLSKIRELAQSPEAGFANEKEFKDFVSKIQKSGGIERFESRSLEDFNDEDSTGMSQQELEDLIGTRLGRNQSLYEKYGVGGKIGDLSKALNTDRMRGTDEIDRLRGLSAMMENQSEYAVERSKGRTAYERMKELESIRRSLRIR